MKKTSIPLIVIAVFSMALLLSVDYNRAWAIAGFQTQSTVNVTGGLTLDTCSGIGITPVTSYIIQQCVNGAGTTQTTVVSFLDGTLIDTLTRTVGTEETDNTDCWGITNTQVVCSTGRASSGQTVLVRITVTSSSSASASTFALPASVIVGGIKSLAGTNVYWGLSNGGFSRFSLSSFSQTGSWSGLQTGGCTTLKGAFALNGNTGLSICDTDEAYLFTYSGSSGAVTITDSATLVGSYTAGASIRILATSNYVYIVDGTQNNVEAIGVDVSDAEFTTSASQYPITANDIKGAGNYVLLLDANTDQIYLIDKEGTAPNNVVVVQSLSSVVGAGTRLATSDSSNFVWSDGGTASTTVLFFRGTDLQNENNIPVNQDTGTSNPTGGIDCDDPDNANILICRLGGTGSIGSAGAYVIGNTTTGTGILGLGCGIGWVDCTEDSNPQTNGLGLLIFMASIFVIVGLFFNSIGKEQTMQIPVYVWVILIISLSAFFTITGLIDPVFLIISVIALIALAAPKVKGILSSGSGFGGGSTE